MLEKKITSTVVSNAFLKVLQMELVVFMLVIPVNPFAHSLSERQCADKVRGTRKTEVIGQQS